MRLLILLSILLFTAQVTFSQSDKNESPKILEETPDPSVTTHEMYINGVRVRYKVTAGYIPLTRETGEAKANIFYVAYEKDGVSDPSKRPLTFSFNGGPGSSSVWLHLGVLGPRRVQMTDNGDPLPPPYKLIDNDYSWLDLTDMVFIDPVSTGFSRAITDKDAKGFHGYNGDIESVGDFIRRYVTTEDRWASPKFVIGESYGTTRASGLSEHLLNKYGMYLNGVILVSAITNFQTARFVQGNDLPHSLFLPTYTASAWYHKRLDKELQEKSLREVLDMAEDFAMNDYTLALMKGDQLSGAERENVITDLSRYTGLSPTYIDRSDLRFNIWNFTKELMRDSATIIGRFDSRYAGEDVFANESYPERDPSYQPAIQGCFSTCINDYLGRELGFKVDLPYEVLTGRVRPWDYGRFENRFVDVSTNLRSCMARNPDMKVWILNGYYDLATPYFATEYTVNHMRLSENQRKQLSMTYYEGGHMMYLIKEELKRMKEHAVDFYKSTVTD